MANNKFGILIDYEYCTGCHSCEVACKKEHNLAEGQFGIQLTQIGPWKINEDKWEYTFMPVVTNLCDLCADRTAIGKVPTCVHHCQAWCMYYGTLEELSDKMTGKTRSVFITPKQ